MKQGLIYFLVILSILFVAIGFYLINQNEFIGLSTSDGV